MEMAKGVVVVELRHIKGQQEGLGNETHEQKTVEALENSRIETKVESMAGAARLEVYPKVRPWGTQ